MWFPRISFGRLYALDEQRKETGVVKKVSVSDVEDSKEEEPRKVLPFEKTGRVRDVRDVLGVQRKGVSDMVLEGSVRREVEEKKGGVLKKSVRVRKQAIHIKLDKEIIAHFKKDGSGYQTRINQVLRRYVERVGS